MPCPTRRSIAPLLALLVIRMAIATPLAAQETRPASAPTVFRTPEHRLEVEVPRGFGQATREDVAVSADSRPVGANLPRIVMSRSDGVSAECSLVAWTKAPGSSHVFAGLERIGDVVARTVNGAIEFRQRGWRDGVPVGRCRIAFGDPQQGTAHKIFLHLEGWPDAILAWQVLAPLGTPVDAATLDAVFAAARRPGAAKSSTFLVEHGGLALRLPVGWNVVDDALVIAARSDCGNAGIALAYESGGPRGEVRRAADIETLAGILREKGAESAAVRRGPVSESTAAGGYAWSDLVYRREPAAATVRWVRIVPTDLGRVIISAYAPENDKEARAVVEAALADAVSRSESRPLAPR